MLGLYRTRSNYALEFLVYLAHHVESRERVVERPRQRCRRRLVPRTEERQHLIQQLLVGHRVAIFIPGLDEHREHVRPPGRSLSAPAMDLVQEDVEHGLAMACVPPPRCQAPQVLAEHREEQERTRRSVTHREESQQGPPQPLELL